VLLKVHRFLFAVSFGFVNFAPSDKINGQHRFQGHLQAASIIPQA